MTAIYYSANDTWYIEVTLHSIGQGSIAGTCAMASLYIEYLFHQWQWEIPGLIVSETLETITALRTTLSLVTKSHFFSITCLIIYIVCTIQKYRSSFSRYIFSYNSSHALQFKVVHIIRPHTNVLHNLNVWSEINRDTCCCPCME